MGYDAIPTSPRDPHDRGERGTDPDSTVPKINISVYLDEHP
jgi:hypothetical protein